MPFGGFASQGRHVTDSPTNEEIQRVRRWECEQRGHSWYVEQMFGVEVPVSVHCSNCGDSHPVGSVDTEESLPNGVRNLGRGDDDLWLKSPYPTPPGFEPDARRPMLTLHPIKRST